MRSKLFVPFLLFSLLLVCAISAEPARAIATTWRQATKSELQTYLPARAPVVKERIETEMPAASGIINNKDQFIGGVVLITAGYSADGKYSHYFLSQVPIQVGSLKLPAGQYILGYVRHGDALEVKFYEAKSGRLLGNVTAKLDLTTHGVYAFKIWPPQNHSMIQIGRFVFPYRLQSPANLR
jgi:hypothetical protein